uniref:Uncharacterized protein n=1 Tax=Megaviridae environmental sample TaxID=1737588 RepID=A0A5J6VKM6_9VIRU|nr:MAG: hypothetical protein [Megaviridae environmental sample]
MYKCKNIEGFQNGQLANQQNSKCLSGHQSPISSNMATIGFIILRNVTEAKYNRLWTKCYKSIRKFYPENKIVIIDDNSNYDIMEKLELYNTIIINSSYKKRGELLPYYYYLNNKWFDIAVIIHDSVFINSHYDFNVIDYKFIWEFPCRIKKNKIYEEKMINVFKNKKLLNLYRNDKWKGCFGCMSIIKHDYLLSVNEIHQIDLLLDLVVSRDNRMCLERVLACMLQYNKYIELNKINDSLSGDILKYCKWRSTFEEIDKLKDLPIIKVWSGR